MSNVLKIILGLFGLLIVLVLAAVVVIPLVVDPNDYRAQVAEAVEERTGRSFEIEGEISLSVFPWLGLEIGGMRLGNPPGFGEQPFARIDSASVGAKLLPLLFRRLEVSTLKLDGLNLELVRLADGENNWSGLAGGPGEPEAEPAQDAGEPGPETGGFSLEQIGGLEISDARIRHEDRGSGSITELMIPKVTTGKLVPGTFFPLEAEVALVQQRGAGETALRATLEATARLADQALSVRGLELRLEMSGPELPGGTQTARLAVPETELDTQAQSLEIPALTLEMASLQVDASLSGTQVIDAPVLEGRVQAEEFSPASLMRALGMAPPETADAGVLKAASLESEFHVEEGRVTLDPLQGRLDDTRLDGSATLEPGETTRVRARLAVDTIDLDRYLAPAEEAPAEAPPGDGALAFDWLRGLDLDASLNVEQLGISGLSLTAVELRAVADDGVLDLAPLSANLYEGTVRGSARLDARDTPATFSLRQSLENLQLQPFASDLADFDRLSGTARLDADLSTRAASSSALLSGLQGDLSFDLADGAFTGVNLWYEIRRAWALMRGGEAPQRESENTEFRRLSGTAQISDGVLVNDDLVGGLPFLALEGEGKVDLAGGEMDYRLQATVIREAVDQASGEISELAGATVPLRLRGPLDSPSVSVAVEDLVRDRAEQEVLRRLGVEEDKSLEDELKDRARKLRDRFRPDD